eukprot:TRINITY_DN5577_c0_g1_i1.p1 TRINITY_DN5577_c0_g1~~TRINITY_DN5577_c0_g1_i1.p1  ORF type:complete len:285 (+),score=80.25 TRINITY_DN5577_c0_g1_i1:55-855(+)
MVELFEDTPGLAIKTIIVEGEGKSVPEEVPSVVEVHCITKLSTGEVVDDTIEREKPFSFVVGSGAVIPALDKCVATMKVGEKATVALKADVGFGEEGCPPSIPGEADLILEVELLSTKNVHLTLEERLSIGEDDKKAGNDHYRSKEFEAALASYQHALSTLRFSVAASDKERKLVNAIKTPCFLNQAACNLALKRYVKVIENCTDALYIDSKSIKALYRRSQAYLNLNQLASAKRDIMKAIHMQPNNAELREIYSQITAKRKANKK